ncbi:MAG: molybdate ABC transporter substrate-binding protein [Brachybacterium sp.]|nr:molybdate ABC transporter substrate-binding protein [Brachybacterium sp.]
MTMLSRRALLFGGALLPAATACSRGGGDTVSDPDGGPAGEEDRRLIVFAAASLTDVFEQVNAAFMADRPEVDVVMTTGGSSDLVTQIGQGAPADVLATADTETMDRAAQDGLIEDTPQLFARNTLTIAVAPGNPEGITGLPDLADADLQVVRCAPQVPCGRVADEVIADTGASLRAVSEENSVTDVLGKVTSGEADAGLVYVTDIVRSGGAADAVPIAGADARATDYPIAAVHGTTVLDLAEEYVAYVRSGDAQALLADAGFGAP